MRLMIAALGIVSVSCADATAPDLGGMPIHEISFSRPVKASSRALVQNDTVRVFAAFQNTGVDTVTMSYGVCSFAVRGALDGGLAWGNRRAWDNRLPPNVACPDVGITRYIAPGEAASFRVYEEPVSGLRLRVPSGSYEVTVYIRVDDRLLEYPAGSIGL